MGAAVKIYDEAPGGARRPAATLRLASEQVTVRDLIRRRVEQEVAAFNARADDVFQGLIQPSGAERMLNGFKLKKRRALDPEKQVQIAEQAFANNGFILLFDDRQVDDLDETVTVTDGCSATFIKLTPLVGG